MGRRRAIAVRASRRLLLLLLALVALWGGGRLVQVAWESHYAGTRGPYLQLLTSDGVSILWQTVRPSSAVVRFGPAAGDAREELAVPEAATRHRVRLEGLIPDTDYVYEVTGLGGGRFHTAPAAGARVPVRLWVQGDPGYPGPAAEAVVEAAFAWMRARPRAGRPLLDLWLTTGDNAYRSGSNPQFQKALFEPRAGLLRDLPVWPAYGNHDARRWAFFDIFELPAAGEAGGLPSGTEHWFALDYGPLHVVFLDTQSADLDAGGDMARWLEADLAATDQPWRIAVFHHPPYTKGSHDSDRWRDSRGRMVRVRENLVPLLEAGGVDLVLSGHSHMYERSHLLACHYGASDTLRPDMILDDGGDGEYVKPARPGAPRAGTVYVVIGSSSKLDQGPLDHPAMAAALARMGSLVIDIDGPRLVLRFIDRDGAVADAFTLHKTGTGAGRTCPGT